MQKDFPTWPQPSRPDNGHTTREIEHRFTAMEAFSETSKADQKQLHKIVESHTEKLTLHERVLLGLLIALATLLQDKFPQLASLLKGLT